MKKTIKTIMVVLLSSIYTISNSQNVYIPDIEFKNYLLSRTDSINIDNDKLNISLQEAINFKGRINIKSKKIQDLNQKLDILLSTWDNLFYTISSSKYKTGQSFLEPVNTFVSNDIIEDIYDYKILINNNEENMNKNCTVGGGGEEGSGSFDRESKVNFFIILQNFCIETTKFLHDLYDENNLREIITNEPFLYFLYKYIILIFQ